jgi:hypothetical protein
MFLRALVLECPDDRQVVRCSLQRLPVERARSQRVGGDAPRAVDINAVHVEPEAGLFEQTPRGNDLVEYLVAVGAFWLFADRGRGVLRTESGLTPQVS